MKIIKCKKYAQQIDELNDHVTDNTIELIEQYNNNDRKVDYNALGRGEVPLTETNVENITDVTDENYESVLADNLVIEQEAAPIEEIPIDEKEVVAPGEVPDKELEVDPTDPKRGFGSDIRGAINEAIRENRVLQIFYTTKGKGSRNEKKYLKREKGLSRTPKGGVKINRIVEPYYIFSAGNGNDILVTYDRSIGRGFIGKRDINNNIRAFIIDNIRDYNFTQNRRTKKPQHFKREPKIVPKIDKGINNMENMNENLTDIATKLDANGMVKSASIVRGAGQVMKNLKTAQYVGIQGYWIRNRRCWDNCYRQKRTTQPETPAQEVWMECWDEYKKSINNAKSGWEKYAKVDRTIKLSIKEEKSLNKFFNSKVKEKTKDGLTVPEAIYATIEEEVQKHEDKLLDNSSKLMTLAEMLNSNNMKDLGERLAEVSAAMMKESVFFAPSEAVKEAQFGGDFANWGNKLRKVNPFSAKSREKGRTGDVIARIKNITQRALQISNEFNTMKQNLHQEGTMQQDTQFEQWKKNQRNKELKDKAVNTVKAIPGQMGDAWNWGKQKANQMATNPAVQQNLPAFSQSRDTIKIAAPPTPSPSYQRGVIEFAEWLRDEFQTFITNLNKESAALSQISVQSTDSVSQQRASQASARIMEFTKKATPFVQSSLRQLYRTATDLAPILQSFANDMNLIQMGQFQESAVGDDIGTDQLDTPSNIPGDNVETEIPSGVYKNDPSAPSGEISPTEKGIKLTMNENQDSYSLEKNPDYDYIKKLISIIEARKSQPVKNK